jgi:prevent-host-death family protein
MADIPEISIDQLRRVLGDRVDAAYHREEATVVTRNGKPRAVLVSYEWFRSHHDTSSR